MLNWLWVRFKAMHWASKLFSAVFLLQAGVYAVQAYQLEHLEMPAFDDLHRVEGKLVLVKQGRDWLTGIEHPDGTRELFTCALPGVGNKNLCFMKDVIDMHRLDAKPDAVLWWYPLTTPLEDRVYRHIFQVQLKNQSKPLSFKRTYDGRVVDEFSYSYTPERLDFQKTHGVRGKLGMVLLYACGVVFVFMWESYKSRMREG